MSLLMDKEAYDREIQNKEDTPAISDAFEKDWLDAMFSRIYPLRRHQKHIFVALDPAGGFPFFLSPLSIQKLRARAAKARAALES